jgi:hypothetical protein
MQILRSTIRVVVRTHIMMYWLDVSIVAVSSCRELEGLSHEYYVLVLWFWGILLCPVLFVLRASRGIGGLSNAF